MIKDMFRQMTFDCLCEIVLFVMDRKDEFVEFQKKLDSEIADKAESEDSGC